MNAEFQTWILHAFLIFCRIGACMMLMPGLSSSRLPVQVRLFFAIGLSLALLPVVEPQIQSGGNPSTVPSLLWTIVTELGTGAFIGFLARIFFLALQALLAASSQIIGFTGLAGTVVDDGEQAPEIATLLTLVATALVFLSGLHWQLLRGLVDSYSQMPMGQFAGAARFLTAVVDQLGTTFILALRITSPFFIYSLIVNFAVGLTNKMVPQIPVYFISIPIVTAGGLLLLYFMVTEMLTDFLDAFGAWVTGM
ncbi:flagellar biosynthetic protein FliR [Aquabacter sp. CN5-332]|uniref:flagellar biosynthetic protein FliR n=1 Tax=Aquabacter sp. CN5-332 TaxID=3156608 RepID=UPI0032B4E814